EEMVIENNNNLNSLNNSTIYADKLISYIEIASGIYKSILIQNMFI
ncbi:38867_t:CDS:1, partial [Gigaspora margarita]